MSKFSVGLFCTLLGVLISLSMVVWGSPNDSPASYTPISGSCQLVPVLPVKAHPGATVARAWSRVLRAKDRAKFPGGLEQFKLEFSNVLGRPDTTHTFETLSVDDSPWLLPVHGVSKEWKAWGDVPKGCAARNASFTKDGLVRKVNKNQYGFFKLVSVTPIVLPVPQKVASQKEVPVQQSQKVVVPEAKPTPSSATPNVVVIPVQGSQGTSAWFVVVVLAVAVVFILVALWMLLHFLKGFRDDFNGARIVEGVLKGIDERSRQPKDNDAGHQKELDEENARLREELRSNPKVAEKVVWHQLPDDLVSKDGEKGVYLPLADTSKEGDPKVKLAGSTIPVLQRNVNNHLRKDSPASAKSRAALRVSRKGHTKE